VLAAVIVCAGLAFGAFYTPGMTLLTHAAEERGLDYGYAFALVNLRLGPGPGRRLGTGGAVAERTSDAVPYLTLAGLALVTLALTASKKMRALEVSDADGTSGAKPARPGMSAPSSGASEDRLQLEGGPRCRRGS